MPEHSWVGHERIDVGQEWRENFARTLQAGNNPKIPVICSEHNDTFSAG